MCDNQASLAYVCKLHKKVVAVEEEEEEEEVAVKKTTPHAEISAPHTKCTELKYTNRNMRF